MVCYGLVWFGKNDEAESKPLSVLGWNRYLNLLILKYLKYRIISKHLIHYHKYGLVSLLKVSTFAQSITCEDTAVKQAWAHKTLLRRELIHSRDI